MSWLVKLYWINRWMNKNKIFVVSKLTFCLFFDVNHYLCFYNTKMTGVMFTGNIFENWSQYLIYYFAASYIESKNPKAC